MGMCFALLRFPSFVLSQAAPLAAVTVTAAIAMADVADTTARSVSGRI
jgi:hypothetical protein